MRPIPCNTCLLKAVCISKVLKEKNKYIDIISENAQLLILNDKDVDKILLIGLMKLNTQCEIIQDYINFDDDDNKNYYNIRNYFRDIILKDLK